jgi:quercetin 2,3-dioxygenase
MHITRQRMHRGRSEFRWLQSCHAFSFRLYRDPKHGFGALRAINEDRLAPGAGFGTYPHYNVEILSWVLSGTLEHKDSLGNCSQIHPVELQTLLAGTGITHSEFNASNEQPLHFLQMWILPDRQGLTPAYEHNYFPPAALADKWCLIASGIQRQGAAEMYRDVDLYAVRMSVIREPAHVPISDHNIWLQVARGSGQTDGETLDAGGAAAWTNAASIRVVARRDAEVLLFDMTA